MQLILIPAAEYGLCHQCYNAYMHSDDRVQTGHVLLGQPRSRPADDVR